MSKTDEVRLLFVYGTLRRSYMRLPVPMRQMRPPHVLDEHGKWSGEGVLRGYALWDVGAYPGVVPAPDGAVVGDLVDVSTMAGMLDVLDEYEGIGGVFERPFEYRREIVDVQVSDGEKGESLRAWVYVYNWPIQSSMKLVADGDYVKYSANKL